jgi:hypothetical protein
VQLDLRVLKVHAYDSVVVAGMGRTHLTCAIVTGKTACDMLACGYSATANHHSLLTTSSHVYGGDATRQNGTLSTSLKSSCATPS